MEPQADRLESPIKLCQLKDWQKWLVKWENRFIGSKRKVCYLEEVQCLSRSRRLPMLWLGLLDRWSACVHRPVFLLAEVPLAGALPLGVLLVIEGKWNLLSLGFWRRRGWFYWDWRYWGRRRRCYSLALCFWSGTLGTISLRLTGCSNIFIFISIGDFDRCSTNRCSNLFSFISIGNSLSTLYYRLIHTPSGQQEWSAGLIPSTKSPIILYHFLFIFYIFWSGTLYWGSIMPQYVRVDL